jgi:PhzF family phenazine biosynthesis protein
VKLKIYQVNAFAKSIKHGNPAGVCLLDGPVSADIMQKTAKIMNLSETAFIYPQEKIFRLRWFTPLLEVDLCGHATLAGAHILWEKGLLKAHRKAIFETKSGRLTAQKSKDFIVLDFPAEPAHKVRTPSLLTKALGIKPLFTGKNRMDYLAVLSSQKEVTRLKPRLEILKRLKARGVMITALSDNKNYDFISRFFGPRAGIDEDPVTGSAHCCLGPYWAEKLGKKKLLGFQASARGGFVRMEVKNSRVLLGGQAVTVRPIHLQIS